MPEDMEIKAPYHSAYEQILTPHALLFIRALHFRFNPHRQKLLQERMEMQKKIDSGWKPCFLPETAGIRNSDWRIPAMPQDLLDRRVEITGPVDRKMMINALNSGANVFMADLEDSNSPGWENVMDGQVNLRDAIRGTITFTNPAGKEYRLNERPAVLFVRPRGWHLDEKHLLVDGEPVAGAFFDFGLFFFHNARKLIERGSGPDGGPDEPAQ